MIIKSDRWMSRLIFNSNLEEEVYMTQPERFVSSGRANQVCKLMRSIYGSKQILKSWNIRFDMTVKEFGFIKNMDEPYVYKKISECYCLLSFVCW